MSKIHEEQLTEKKFENQSQQASQNEPLEKDHQLLDSICISDWLDKYEQYLERNKMEMKEVRKVAIEIVTKNGVFKTNYEFFPDLEIKYVKTDLQSAIIELSWGYFKTNAHILKINVPFNQLHFSKVVNKGAFGNIYSMVHEGRKYAVKALQLPKRKKKDYYLKLIYQQYFLHKVGNELRISPQIQNIFGYDIVVFQDNAIFCQEYQWSIEEQIRIFGKQSIIEVEKSLKESLKYLHSLKICHCDIKPDNIVWNKQNNIPLLVDFGLSKVINEEIGQKTHTNYGGTFKYSSMDMKKLYILRQGGFVDLYYNDVVGLQSTIQQISLQASRYDFIAYGDSFNNRQQSYLSQSSTNLIILRNIFVFKHYLFLRQYKQALELICHQNYFVKSAYKIFIEQFCLKKKYEELEMNEEDITKYHQMVKQKSDNYIGVSDPLLRYVSEIYDLGRQTVFRAELKVQNIINSSINAQLLKILLNDFDNVAFVLNFFSHTLLQTQEEQDKIHQYKALIAEFYQKIEIYLDVEKNQQIPFSSKVRKMILYFYNKFSSKHTPQNLLKFRLLFRYLKDYISSQRVESQIVKLPEYQDNIKFFIIRIYFYLERIKWWESNELFYPHTKWISQVKGKKINNSEIQYNLKENCITILGGISLQTLQQHTQACQFMQNLYQLDQFNRKIGSQFKQKVKAMISILTQVRQVLWKTRKQPIQLKDLQFSKKRRKQSEYTVDSLNITQHQQNYENKKFTSYDSFYFFRHIKVLNLLQKKKTDMVRKITFNHCMFFLAQLQNQSEAIEALEFYQQVYIQNEALYFLHIEHVLLTLNRMPNSKIVTLNRVIEAYLKLLDKGSLGQKYNKYIKSRICIMISIFISSSEHFLFYACKVENSLSENHQEDKKVVPAYKQNIKCLVNHIEKILVNGNNIELFLPKVYIVMYHTLKIILNEGIKSYLQSLSYFLDSKSPENILIFEQSYYGLLRLFNQSRYAAIALIHPYGHSKHAYCVQCHNHFPRQVTELNEKLVSNVAKYCLERNCVEFDFQSLPHIVYGAVNQGNLNILNSVQIFQKIIRTLQIHKSASPGFQQFLDDSLVSQLMVNLLNVTNTHQFQQIVEKICHKTTLLELKQSYRKSIVIFYLLVYLQDNRQIFYQGNYEQNKINISKFERMRRRLAIMAMIGVKLIVHRQINHKILFHIYSLSKIFRSGKKTNEIQIIRKKFRLFTYQASQEQKDDINKVFEERLKGIKHKNAHKKLSQKLSKLQSQLQTHISVYEPI